MNRGSKNHVDRGYYSSTKGEEYGIRIINRGESKIVEIETAKIEECL